MHCFNEQTPTRRRQLDPFPINWTRTQRSNLSTHYDDELGARWITRLDLVSEGLRYRAADGRRFDYSLLNVGEDHGDRMENLKLISISDWQIALGLSLDRRETYRRDGKRFLPVQIKLRGSARILLWQGEGPDPRAIHEWADDGSFEMHLEWDSNN